MVSLTIWPFILAGLLNPYKQASTSLFVLFQNGETDIFIMLERFDGLSRYNRFRLINRPASNLKRSNEMVL